MWWSACVLKHCDVTPIAQINVYRHGFWMCLCSFVSKVSQFIFWPAKDPWGVVSQFRLLFYHYMLESLHVASYCIVMQCCSCVTISLFYSMYLFIFVATKGKKTHSDDIIALKSYEQHVSRQLPHNNSNSNLFTWFIFVTACFSLMV